ncbi:hypothetical protein ACFLS0_03115 [Candidatus Bipolaricaulota bacterium]
MKRTRRGGLASVLLIIVLGVLLAGCGNFRQQALEAQDRINEAVQRAKIAEAAAARNAGRIIELEDRVEILEAALAAPQGIQTND